MEGDTFKMTHYKATTADKGGFNENRLERVL